MLFNLGEWFFFQNACVDNMSTNLQIRTKVLKCLSSWYSIDAIPETIVQTSLFTAPFNTLVSSKSKAKRKKRKKNW